MLTQQYYNTKSGVAIVIEEATNKLLHIRSAISIAMHVPEEFCKKIILATKTGVCHHPKWRLTLSWMGFWRQRKWWSSLYSIDW